MDLDREPSLWRNKAAELNIANQGARGVGKDPCYVMLLRLACLWFRILHLSQTWHNFGVNITNRAASGSWTLSKCIKEQKNIFWLYYYNILSYSTEGTKHINWLRLPIPDIDRWNFQWPIFAAWWRLFEIFAARGGRGVGHVLPIFEFSSDFPYIGFTLNFDYDFSLFTTPLMIKRCVISH